MDKTKNRSEIEEVYKWDLKKIYENEDKVNEAIDKIKYYHNEVLKFKGKITENSENLYKFFKTFETLEREMLKLYAYANMTLDGDTSDSEGQAFKMKIEKMDQDIGATLSFINPEILELEWKQIEKMIVENPNLKLYEFHLKDLFKDKEHTLDEKSEEIISRAMNAMGTGYNAFFNLDNTDINLETIKDENGNEVELNDSNYSKYVASKNIEVRKQAFFTMYKYWKGIKNTVAATYSGQIKENFFLSNIRKYKSPLEASLSINDIDVKVYKNLIETVHKNIDKLYKYYDLKKEALGLNELHLYDTNVDIVEQADKDIPFEKTKKIIFEALKPLGTEYLEDLKKAFDERWIDVYPNKFKKTGAYSGGTYDTYPYLLLNYNNTTDYLMTTAHELGHSMHSYYANKNQEYIYSNYPIFSAEIASTVNEILLNEYLYKTAETIDDKKYYLTELLDRMKATIFRQTMFAEFEMIMHDKYDNGISLTSKEFSDTYYELNKLYYGDNVIVDDDIRYEWERIPHFYDSFYTYQYATGMSAAIAFASDILNHVEGAKERYLEFLSSGSKDYPIELLKKAGVDMTVSTPIQKALDMFENKVEELKKLI